MSGFLLICIVAIVAGGIGYWLGRRAAEREHAPYPAGQVPLQERDGPQDYYRPYPDGPGYRQQGYMSGQQGYMSQQRQGMNPLVAGGLGAAAGGLMGYGLGQAMAENEPDVASSGDAAPADAGGGIEESFADVGDFVGGEW
jgi:hypothetical protein